MANVNASMLSARQKRSFLFGFRQVFIHKHFITVKAKDRVYYASSLAFVFFKKGELLFGEM